MHRPTSNHNHAGCWTIFCTRNTDNVTACWSVGFSFAWLKDLTYQTLPTGVSELYQYTSSDNTLISKNKTMRCSNTYANPGCLLILYQESPERMSTLCSRANTPSRCVAYKLALNAQRHGLCKWERVILRYIVIFVSINIFYLFSIVNCPHHEKKVWSLKVPHIVTHKYFFTNSDRSSCVVHGILVEWVCGTDNTE